MHMYDYNNYGGFHLQSIIESDSALEWSRDPVDEGFGLGGFT